MPWRDVIVVGVTGSTNADLAERVRAGSAPAGTVIAAAQQTAGRGRLGRSWSSPRGTLSFSVALSPPEDAIALVPLVMGIGVVEGLRQLTGIDVVLKWPNDVQIANGKVAGLLAERIGDQVVAGCGLNISLTAEELPVPTATSLSLHTPPPSREQVLVACLSQLARRVEEWDRGRIIAEYRTMCDTLGRSIVVRLPGGAELAGQALAIDSGGRLVVGAADGEHVIDAGDVEYVRTSL